MTIRYCSNCGTARQRNIVNCKEVTDNNDKYTCLECLLFPSGINKKAGGRYYKAVYREIKSCLTGVRCALPTVCPFRDISGYYIVDAESLIKINELVKIKLSNMC